MAITMDLEEAASDSQLLRDSKNLLRDSSSSVSVSKSETGIAPVVQKTSSAEQLKQYKSWVSNERWAELKKIAESAMRDHRVFMIKNGGWHSIRRALVQRGWIEKYETHKVRHPPGNIDPKKVTGKELTKIERIILYKFMEHYSVDFLWTTKRDRYDWILSNKDVIISRFCRSIFTTKEGLAISLQQTHWYTEPGVSYIRFPRCYNIQNSESLEEFIDDFRITACISLLQWLCNTLEKITETEMSSYGGKVPFSCIDFAIKRLNTFVSFHSHFDIDEVETETEHVWEHEWDQFLTHHFLLVHENAKFSDVRGVNVRNLEKKATKVLAAVTKFWPQREIDGVLNIWIVKPGNKCRGRGIHLMNNIKDIISLVNVSSQKTRYVVQKYVERPLVIYNTKFDIRQWFLVTCCQPLTIWVYKDCYLRFSSQIFSLANYHESVHLTNNAVQSKYKNNNQRDKALPDENMWDNQTFKAYLKQIGKYEMWDTKIYPGIKQCLVGAMLACQDSMDKRQNSFEMYGADFMVTSDFTPWLIEINSSPDLAPTTSVTARLCPQCLEDLIKVVIDRRTNPDADTGTFELAYKQFIPKSPAYLGLSLCLNGKRLYNKKSSKDRKHEVKCILPEAPSVHIGDAIIDDKPIPAEYSGPIITDFLSWLNPYDALPTNAEGLLLGPKHPNTVRQAMTVVKSSIASKHSSKKRKSSAASSRKQHRGKREKNSDCRRRIVPHSCCRPEEVPSLHVGKYRTESAGKSEKAKSGTSVGNKRCYIDPIEWERQTTSILRPTISVQNKSVNRSEIVPWRQTKSSGVNPSYKPIDSYNSRTCVNDENSLSKLSAIGTSICKIRDENKPKKGITFSKSCTSIYTPFRVVVTPMNDEIENPQNVNLKSKMISY